jgi:hypothetical protein
VLISFDPAKREKTLSERGLDFRRAKEVFEHLHLTRLDDRREYGEQRFVSTGLDGRIVIIVWTSRGRTRRIISMRKANEREVKRLSPHLA